MTSHGPSDNIPLQNLNHGEQQPLIGSEENVIVEQTQDKQAQQELLLQDQRQREEDQEEQRQREQSQQEQDQLEQAQLEQDQKRKEYFDYKNKLKRKCFKVWKCSSNCTSEPEFHELLKYKEHDQSYTNKSSIISLILREKENQKFWDGSDLEDIMSTYIVENDDNLKDFFSILMYDWHEYEEKQNKNYFLIRKFQAFSNAFVEYENKMKEDQTYLAVKNSNGANQTNFETISETKRKENNCFHCCLPPFSTTSGQLEPTTSAQAGTTTSDQSEPKTSDQSEPTTSDQLEPTSSKQSGPATSQSNEATSTQSKETIFDQSNPTTAAQSNPTTATQSNPTTSGQANSTEEGSSTVEIQKKINKTIFEKLFNVISNESLKIFHSICLKIIYYFVDEVLTNYENNKKEFLPQVKIITEEALKINNNAEYKIKILKIFAIFLKEESEQSEQSEDSEDNNSISDNELCDKIKEFLKQPTITYDGKTSYDFMLDHCDRLFFNLVFSLKEHLITEFKDDYKNFIKLYKSYFGEYWTFAIKENGRLLYSMTTVHGQNETGMFLLNETGESMLKLSITSIFNDVAEFQVIFNEPLDVNDRKNYDILKSFVHEPLIKYKFVLGFYVKSLKFEQTFSNTPQIRRFLFGRENFHAKSIFEDILSHNYLGKHLTYFDDLINYIWNEFKLWDTPQILTLRNPLGKRYIDFVNEFCHDNQKIQFLNIKHLPIYGGIQKPLNCMMLKSSLFPIGNWKDTSNQVVDGNFENLKVKNYIGPFVDFHVTLISNTEESDEYEYESKNLPNVLYLLEEMNQYCTSNAENFEVIKKVHDYSPNDDNRKHFLESMKNFFLGLMMIHWNYYVTNDKENKPILQSLPSNNEQHIKSEGISSDEPFLYLISLIVTKNYDKFLEEFSNKMKEIVTKYKTKKGSKKEKIEEITTDRCFVFLYGAIKANQKEIINEMFAYNSFIDSIHEFPPNITPEEIHSYTIKKYLEYKFQLKRGVDIPDYWITNKVMKEFLDSRITSQENFYKIDCRFLLPHENQDDSFKKPTDDSILKEEFEAMKYFMENYKLKSLVTHPVMEIVLRTKIEIYNRIFFWNLVLFFLLYIIPTGVVLFCLHVDKDEDINLKSVSIMTASGIRIGFMFIREFIQCFGVYGPFYYFTKKSNYIEIILFFLSFATLLLYGLFGSDFYVTLITLEAANTVLMTFSTVNMYPNFFRQSIYLKCFFKVLRTYLWILLLLIPLSIGSIGIIFILFTKANKGKIEEFENIGNTTIKYFIMYNGELGINAKDIVGIVQIVAIVIVVIFTMNKANLILSIVVDDVQKILDQAREITLTKYANKYIDFAERIEKLHERYESIMDEYKKSKKLEESKKSAKSKPKSTVTDKSKFEEVYNRIKKCLRISCINRTRLAIQIKIVQFLIRKYPRFHELRYFYVDKVTKCVHIHEQRPLFEYGFWSHKCWRSGGKIIQWIRKVIIDAVWDLNLKLDSSTLNEIKDIVTGRMEENSENKKDQEINRLREQNDSLIKTIEALGNEKQ